MLRLTLAARLCNRSPADLVGIVDEEIAFAFNMECAETLHEDEVERQMVNAVQSQLPPELEFRSGPRRIRQ